MKNQTQWLFETPPIQAIENNNHDYSHPELENDGELQTNDHYFSALQEAEWEAISESKVPKRVMRSSVRGLKTQGITTNICNSLGKPEILDRFGYDKDQLQPFHRAQIVKVARCVIFSQKTTSPIRSLRIIGHTDPSGSAAYNLQLGRRRAEQVKQYLYQSIDRLKRGYARQIRFVIETQGEKKPISKEAAKNRRVEIFLPTKTPGWNKRIPSDRGLCGVPQNKAQTEIGFESGLYELERSAKPRVYARLCLYQNASTTSHRNHFHCQADRWAKRVRAYAAPGVARVGPTQYDTGADIIGAIEAANTTLNKPVEIVHIFSHSGSHGIFGGLSGGTVGLYYGALEPQSRQQGGRIITDIPTTPLSQNVIFVLHGCNTGSGDDNFAKALYEYLVNKLENPRVYGHYNSGCCGRDNSWRRYSKQSPNGKNLSSIQPFYEGDGCC